MQLLFISVLLAFSTNFISTEPCEELICEIEITDSSEGLNNGMIEVIIVKSSSKVKAYLYGDNRSKNKLNVDIDKLNKLEPGSYLLVLQNNKCSIVKHDIIIK